jgi:hypothetical protein
MRSTDPEAHVAQTMHCSSQCAGIAIGNPLGCLRKKLQHHIDCSCAVTHRRCGWPGNGPSSLMLFNQIPMYFETMMIYDPLAFCVSVTRPALRYGPEEPLPRMAHPADAPALLSTHKMDVTHRLHACCTQPQWLTHLAVHHYCNHCSCGHLLTPAFAQQLVAMSCVVKCGDFGTSCSKPTAPTCVQHKLFAQVQLHLSPMLQSLQTFQRCTRCAAFNQRHWHANTLLQNS